MKLVPYQPTGIEPVRYDRRCAFPEVPLAFDLQNASHHQYALACGYLQSPTFHDTAAPLLVFMGIALGCSLGLMNPYNSNTMLAVPVPLPAGD